jgi:hypothetical protein
MKLKAKLEKLHLHDANFCCGSNHSSFKLQASWFVAVVTTVLFTAVASNSTQNHNGASLHQALRVYTQTPDSAKEKDEVLTLSVESSAKTLHVQSGVIAQCTDESSV